LKIRQHFCKQIARKGYFGLIFQMAKGCDPYKPGKQNGSDQQILLSAFQPGPEAIQRAELLYHRCIFAAEYSFHFLPSG
jgi:hypothetical protein